MGLLELELVKFLWLKFAILLQTKSQATWSRELFGKILKKFVTF